MLPEPIPLGGIASPGAAVDRALLESGRCPEESERRISRCLCLVAADPVGVLEKLEGEEIMQR